MIYSKQKHYKTVQDLLHAFPDYLQETPLYSPALELVSLADGHSLHVPMDFLEKDRTPLSQEAMLYSEKKNKTEILFVLIQLKKQLK